MPDPVAQTRKEQLTGFALIASGTILISTVPVVSKIVMREMSSVHFSFFWMCFGLLYTLAFALIKGPRRSFRAVRREWKYLLAAGASAFVWVILAFAGIKRLDPTVSIVFFNSRGVWGVLIGLTLLHERYSLLQYVGMAVIVAGLGINLIDAGGTDEVLGSLMTVSSAFAYVITNMLIKRFVSRSGVIPGMFARFALPAIAMFLLGVGGGIPFELLRGKTLLLLAGGSFIGPFLSFVLIYSSLKYLDLGIQSFFQCASLFFTAIISFLVLGSIPTPLQIAGGLVVVSGMVIMGAARLRAAESRSKNEAEQTQPRVS